MYLCDSDAPTRVLAIPAVAGLEGEQCFLWNFDRTHIAEGGSEDEENRHAQTKGKKKKKGRCPKERKRFPKRTTK